MVDNVESASGSGGPTFATDDDGTAHHPYCKVEWGADNTQTKVDTGTGALPVQGAAAENAAAAANPVLSGGRYDATPRTLGDGDAGAIALDVNGNVVVSGVATAANQSTGNASLATIAGAVSGTEMQVDILTSVLPLGAATAANQSTANTSLSTIAGAVSGTEMQADIVAPIPAGANLVGDVGLSGARTSGGTTLYKNIDVDDSEDQVKGSAGQVYWIHAVNTTAALLYLKFYNATAASVTVGTTTPDLTFPVPGNADSDGAGFTLAIPNGIEFDTAITVAATTGVADADTGAPGANALILNMGYA